MRKYAKIRPSFVILLLCFLPCAKMAWGFSIVRIDQVIHFSAGSAEIREVSLPILEDVAALLKANPEMQAIVEGHTDAFEGKRDAVGLSRKRAQATKDFLIKLGVDPHRLTIAAYGSARPVASNHTEEGRAKNRRIEFNSFFSPPVFEGVREVPVTELEKKFEKEREKKGSASLMSLARLNQVVYARQVVSLPVETWSGTDYYAWNEGDPAEEKLSSPPKKDTDDRLKKAIRYFSEVIQFPPEPYIGGLPNYPAERKLLAYRGLIWCLWQSGQEEKARKLYPKYLEAAKALDKYEDSHLLSAWQLLGPVLGPNSELRPQFKKIELLNSEDLLKKWNAADLSDTSLMEEKADLLLNLYLKNSKQVFVQNYPNRSLPTVRGYVSGEKTQDPALKQSHEAQLDEAIALYEEILKMSPIKSFGGYPESVGDGRFRVQRKLVSAQAQRQSKEQALASYQALLKDAFALDQRLLEFPRAQSDHSWQVWQEMQVYLDPQKDAAYIQETEQRLKNAKLKAHR